MHCQGNALHTLPTPHHLGYLQLGSGRHVDPAKLPNFETLQLSHTLKYFRNSKCNSTAGWEAPLPALPA